MNIHEYQISKLWDLVTQKPTEDFEEAKERMIENEIKEERMKADLIEKEWEDK